MSNQFNSISGAKRSLHVQVARDIARGVLSGELPVGSIIPNEQDLCEQFGVSRTALREAVKLLTAKGLLESRPKIGTKVMERSYWNFLDSQLLEWMDGLMDTDLLCTQFLDFRKAIEPEACALAASHATVEQRIELSELFQKMTAIATAPEFDQESWIDIDLQFHRLIFSSTGNHFYLPFGHILTTMFINFFIKASHEGNVCLEDHKNIYESIMAGNAEKARAASCNHLIKSQF